MNNQSEQALGILKIERSFDATPEALFAAFTQPELMAKWFFGFPQGSARVIADLRVGGKYSIEMFAAASAEPGSECQCGNGRPHYGEYLEIDPPRRLVFTWIKSGFVEYSVVTIELKASGPRTLLTLSHRVPSETVQSHTQGWGLCLDNLQSLLAKLRP